MTPSEPGRWLSQYWACLALSFVAHRHPGNVHRIGTTPRVFQGLLLALSSSASRSNRPLPSISLVGGITAKSAAIGMAWAEPGHLRSGVACGVLSQLAFCNRRNSDAMASTPGLAALPHSYPQNLYVFFFRPLSSVRCSGLRGARHNRLARLSGRSDALSSGSGSVRPRPRRLCCTEPL